MNISCREPKIKHAPPETNYKAPKTSNDNEIYKYVLASAKIIWNYKNLQVTEGETNASIHLFEKCSDDNVNFHFDTTSRCSRDGEWPAMKFSFKVRFNVPLLLFAYEDRANITDLIIQLTPVNSNTG